MDAVDVEAPSPRWSDPVELSMFERAFGGRGDEVPWEVMVKAY
jgi:hypothetical protein